MKIQRRRSKSNVLMGTAIMAIAAAACLAVIPLTANANDGVSTAAVNRKPLITLGTSVLEGGSTGGIVGDTVYYANYDATDDDEDNPTAIQWRVLTPSNDSDVNTDGKQESVLMVTEYVYDSFLQMTTTGTASSRYLTSINNGKIVFNNTSSLYAGSNLQSWYTDFLKNQFSTGEQAAIANTYTNDPAPDQDPNVGKWYYDYISSPISGDKLFAPSAFELLNSDYGFSSTFLGGNATRLAYIADSNFEEWPGVNARSYLGCYWTRTTGSSGYAYTSGSQEGLDIYSIKHGNGARPEMNLKTSSVLFTSQAAGGKPTEIINGSTVEWPTIATGAEGGFKFTILDDADQKITLDDATRSGDVVNIAYSGATTGSNQRISAEILSSDGSTLVEYANIADLSSASAASGTIALTLPSGFDSNGYQLKIFSEQCNGDYETDYASTPISVLPVSSAAAITSFSLPGQTGTAVVDDADSTVLVSMPAASDVSSLAATFALSAGASATVNKTTQTSGSTVNNFTSAVEYIVTAADGTTRTWNVDVKVGGSSEKAIESMDIGGVSGTIDAQAHTVAFTLPFGTSLTSISAKYMLSNGATADIASGASVDLSTPVSYTVRAEDGSTQVWTVTATTAAAKTGNDITSFSVDGAVSSTIDSADHTVVVSYPYATTDSAKQKVRPVIGVSDGAQIKPSSTRMVDLSGKVGYVVTAQDGSSQVWYVSSVNLKNTENAITSFSINDVPGVIDADAHTVTVSLPYSMASSDSCYTPTLSVSPDATITPGSGRLQSFASPVSYTVTAQDGTTQVWTVTVNVAALSSENQVLSFSIGDSVGVIDQNARTIKVETPYATDLSSLAATFKLSTAATASVGGVTQVSGVTQNDFSKTVSYSITAEDGTSVRSYKVTVTAASNTWTQLAGGAREGTAATIANAGFGSEGSSVAILATSKNFPDALAASALAGIKGAPILLTDPEQLSEETSDELTALGVKKVYIVGGESAVSASVENEVETLMGNEDNSVVRLSGSSRFETALSIYGLGSESGSWSDTIIICNGFSFADSLSIAPYSYASSSPILITGSDGLLTDKTRLAISNSSAKNIILVGGSSVVDDGVMTQLGSKYTYLRLSGGNRYETSSAVANWETGGDSSAVIQPEVVLGFDDCAVATGKNFPDALSGGAFCGHLKSVLMLVDDGTEAGLTNVTGTISNHKTLISQGYFLGGDGVISPTLQTKIRRANSI